MSLARFLPAALSRVPWRSRVVVIGGTATAAVLLIGGGTAFAMDQRITLNVDGESETVRTFGSATVTEILDEAGVELDEHDAVAPEPDASVERGDHVVVRYARPFTLTLNDEETETHQVTALTVGEALEQLGHGDEPLALSAERGDEIPRDGIDVEARSAKNVVILRDQVRIETETVAESVEELLAAQRIEPGEHDIVTPDPETEPTDGMVVSVLELLSEPETEEIVIEAEVEEIENDEMERGERNTVEEPQDGLKEVTTAMVLMDGEETEHVLDEEVIEEPVDGVVEVGTQEPEPEETEESSSSDVDPNVGGDVDSLNWSGLAQCESGGNPTVVNPAGPYYGLYQFQQSTWESVGGTGLPSEASPDEQTMRAKMLYEAVGGNWQSQWPECGRHL